MAFEGSGVPEVRSAVIYPLYKGKGERTKSRNYICISLLSINEKKIYRGFSRQSPQGESSIDDEQRGFRGGKGCAEQIFTLKQIGEKVQEISVCVFHGFGEGI